LCGQTYPSVALALQMANDVGDVVLNYIGELGLVLDVADPGWQLRVPDKSVASHDLLVLGCVVGKVVGASERELVLGGLGGVPFLDHYQSSLTQHKFAWLTMLFSGVT